VFADSLAVSLVSQKQRPLCGRKRPGRGLEWRLSIKCYENRIRVFVDHKEVSVFEPKANRSTGYAQFYLGNPWEEPANVTVKNLRMFDLQEFGGKEETSRTIHLASLWSQFLLGWSKKLRFWQR
jgi:hypothetical protein